VESFWNTSISVSKILNNNETIIAGTPENNALDRVFFPVSLRGRASITWARGSWNATLSGNYVGKYRNDSPITVNNVRQPEADVPSWGTMDLNIGYGIPANSGLWGLDGVRLSVTAQNVFDRDPPIVLVGSTANDARNHSPLGRQWQFSFTKQF
jgi:iron complex outermembrane receptor protein